MRRLLIILSLLVATFTCSAEEFVFDFKNASDSERGKDWVGTDEWTNAYPMKKCKARVTGIGIAPSGASGGQSAMLWTPAEKPWISTITVACTASTEGAAKEHTLGITINGELLVAEKFTLSAVGDVWEQGFTLETPIEVASMVISNETDGDVLFDVQKVGCFSGYPPIQATIVAPSQVKGGSKFLVSLGGTTSLDGITGGSGTYVSAVWNGGIAEVDLSDMSLPVEFMAPLEDGEYTLKLVVTDSAGTVATFTHPYTVYSHVPATDLKATEITKESFNLHWSLPAEDSPIAFTVHARPLQEKTTVEQTLTLESGEVSVDMDALIEGYDVESAYIISDVAVECQMTDADWVALESYAGVFYALPEAMRSGRITVRAEGVSSIKLMVLFKVPRTVSVRELATTQRSMMITGLSAGRTYDVTVMTEFRYAELTSLPLRVTTEAIPTFSQVDVVPERKCIYPTWPTTVTATSGTVEYWQEEIVTRTLPEGLYLTRLYLTGKGDETLSTMKAVVISNTSSRTIALDGSWTLKALRPRTATEIANGKTEPVVSTWDFSVTDEEKNKHYPYTVPAGENLLFFAERYDLPADLSQYPNAHTTTATALRNFNAQYTLSLLQGETIVNELKPVMNTVQSLAVDQLSECVTTAITKNEALPTVLDASWIPATTMHCVARQRIAPGAAVFYYTAYAPDTTNLQRFWAELFVNVGSDTSAAYHLPIYTREEKRRGFRFRVR